MRGGGVFGGEAVETGARAAKQCCRRCFSAPLLFARFPAARGGDGKRQNSLSCALCCAALSLSEQFQLTNLRMRDSARIKGTADDRHPAELSSTCRVCRVRWRDRSVPLDRPCPRRLPAARSEQAAGL